MSIEGGEWRTCSSAWRLDMREFLALLKKDLRATRNLGRVAREQSSFKIGFILVFASSILLGLWMLFAEGFRFLDSLGGVGLMLISRLFALFFLGLGVMLALSSILASYTTFFRSNETAFLFLKPLGMGQIALYKALQSAVYSSWAFSSPSFRSSARMRGTRSCRVSFPS